MAVVSIPGEPSSDHTREGWHSASLLPVERVKCPTEAPKDGSSCTKNTTGWHTSALGPLVWGGVQNKGPTNESQK